MKMREVYERSPQMGDASSLVPRLEEVKQSLQQLEDELRRNQVYTKNKNTSQFCRHTVCIYSVSSDGHLVSLT